MKTKRVKHAKFMTHGLKHSTKEDKRVKSLGKQHAKRTVNKG